LILIEAFMDLPARQQRSARQPKAHLQTPSAMAAEPIAVGVNAAIFAVQGDEPVVAVVPVRREERGGEGALPSGLFSPRQHDDLEAALRFCVKQQTGMELGSARQICTLGGRHGSDAEGPSQNPVLAVCYLALVAPERVEDSNGVGWRSWYAYFPWEDWRRGKPACLTEEIEPRLQAWTRLTAAHCQSGAPRDQPDRRQRLRIAFGCDGAAWDEEKALARYELLLEAGLLGETAAAGSSPHAAPIAWQMPKLWHPMLGDQARVLANAIGEVRRSVKWQPAIFELVPDLFTLFELQKTVEAILGPHLHKQNFRRLVETGGLVEPTGEYRFRTGGRPAQLYRFRRDVLLERLAPGVRIKTGRA
jgi:hypothetical protein